jgi:hypothetical protein
MLYIKADEKWRRDTSKSVVTDLTRKGYKNAKYLYDDNGNIRSEKEYITELAKNKAISNEELGSYLAKVKKEKGNEAYEGYKKIIGMTLGRSPEFINNLEKIAGSVAMGVNPGGYLAGKTGKLFEGSQNFDYSDLHNEASKSYSDAKVVKSHAIRLGTGPIDPGTGLTTVGSSVISVNPKGMTVGKAKFGEVLNDLKGFDWSGSKDRVTVNGISKDAYDKSSNNYNNLGKAVMDKISLDFNKAKSSLSTFQLKVAPIAGGSGNLSSVTIKPNAEWIKANTAKTKTVGDKTVVTEPGLLMPDQANAILKNGISYVMDNKKMNNSMYKASYQSPIEGYVDYFGKYEINDIGGDPMKSYKIEKNKLGTGDYTTTITYPQYNPDKGVMEKITYRNNIGYTGDNLTNMKNSLIYGFMDDIDMQNTLEYNNFEKVNQ